MKTMSLLLIASAAILVPMCSHAATLDDANEAFAAGKYHDSTQDYQAVLAANGYSAPVLFDLGNSLFREGDIGQAILAYKRAQWLAPGDPDIAANLQLAQKQAGVAVADPQWSDKLTNLLSASGWAWLGCAAWTLFCASLLGWKIAPQGKSLFSLVAVADAVVLAAAIGAIVVSSSGLGQAVVTDKSASALISPFPAAQTVFSPAPGETVTVQKAYNDFLLATDHAGHTGWVSKTQVTPVVPTAG
jgi:tetratricopeptide (TPR) repeat protein